ncbi:pyrimidine-nucleoside phosphorylase [Alicyclobacillus sp.]|uniref:pyrimidine-nucleoside phosphorylase n=1 Tax=Alicyclobacillus sp. TaxID=61169 RepID=UPI0025BF5647|nr:pyrimidine-nucleoside phosphorylase [Alicyclobacillus sp.]MCL6516724.1 pyrimidine-nucleoside phosphorylase [Alicyclobacillus sp.]
MRMYDLIHKKRLGQALSPQELTWMVDGYVRGDIPDYQMSAFAMAVVWRGMTDEETKDLTLAMAHSGHVLDLSSIPGVKVDKHSTGGVGDTTTLVLAPWVASVGVPVAKMSGRGLGHTGGTIDKLESIPGFSCDLSMEAFLEQVRRVGVAVAAQTAELAPADKKLYALRDVTDTVESVPLIASSIMSKKIASGADAIVLDVKVGDGAFMKDIHQARRLAKAMVEIGHRAGRRTVAVLTNMDEPLGRAIGNALEVREAIQTLRGQGSGDLTELCLTLGSEMVVLAGRARDAAEARALLQQALADGRALRKWKEFVRAQGGDERVADDLSLLPKAPVVRPLHAWCDGVVAGMRAEEIGLVAMRLGAGRVKHGDAIDPAVGIVLHRKVGDPVVRGEVMAEIHAASEAAAEEAVRALQECIAVHPGEPFSRPLVLEILRHGDRPDHVPGSERAANRPLQAEEGAEALVAAARSAMAQAYVPYSGFAVGAALRLSDGTVVTGANVENASYGLTNCAERTALFRWAASPARGEGVSVTGIAVIADSPEPVAPCGACRQVLAEFCHPDTPVWLANLRGEVRHTTVGALLPHAFGPAQMRGTPDHGESRMEGEA